MSLVHVYNVRVYSHVPVNLLNIASTQNTQNKNTTVLHVHVILKIKHTCNNKSIVIIIIIIIIIIDS